MTLLLLAGCSGGNTALTNLTGGQQTGEDVSNLLSLSPAREEIKNYVITEITGGNLNNSPIRKSPGNTYFTLSKASVEVVSNVANVVYAFIYIENYGSGFEVYYEGTLTYLYEKITTPLVYWELSDITVDITEVAKGNVAGVILNAITGNPIEGAIVYGVSGDERTVAVSTDENGEYLINNVLENVYTIHAVYPEFESNLIEDVEVIQNQTTNADVINLIPGEDDRFISIEGYVYFDAEKTRPVEDAVVFVYSEEGELSSVDTGVTDENGYYKINFVSEGIYLIYAIKEMNMNDGQEFEVVFQDIQSGSTVMVNDIFLLNNDPEIISFSHTNPVTLMIDEEIELEIEPYDEDGDLLVFEWYADYGDLGFSTGNSNTWSADTIGNYEVTIYITDKKGGEVTHTFEIVVE
jgi:hypothetical protein